MTEQQMLRIQVLAQDLLQARERLVLAQEAFKRADAEFNAFVRSLVNDEKPKAGRP